MEKTFAARLIDYEIAKEVAEWLRDNDMLRTPDTTEQIAYDFAIRFAQPKDIAAFTALKKARVL